MTTNTTHVHTFTLAGMGEAPFRFLFCFSIPSATLAEQNPDAYNNALRAMPKLKAGCGTCAACGMAIMNVFVVQNQAGERYGVGCDCVEKTGDAGLIAKVKIEKRKARLAAQEAKQRAYMASPAYKAKMAEYQAEQAALKAAQKARDQAFEAHLIEACAAVGARASYLFNSQNAFIGSLLEQLKRGGSLSGRQAECLTRELVGRRTKANAEQFDALLAMFTAE